MSPINWTQGRTGGPVMLIMWDPFAWQHWQVLTQRSWDFGVDTWLRHPRGGVIRKVRRPSGVGLFISTYGTAPCPIKSHVLLCIPAFEKFPSCLDIETKPWESSIHCPEVVGQQPSVHNRVNWAGAWIKTCLVPTPDFNFFIHSAVHSLL